MLELPVGALGEVDRPHTPVPELLRDPIRSDDLSARQRRRLGLVQQGLSQPIAGVLEEVAR